MYSISLFVLFFKYIIIHASVLNIDELNSIHYSIDIVNIPVLKNKDWSEDIVTVTNKHGQEYICTLPEVQIPENENKKEEDLLDQLVDISELLKPMEAAPCLIKKKDWWSYEFCYGSVIKQYHLEDNKVVGNILILGKYDSEYNWKNSSKTKNKLQKFHTQNYVNGSRCDITGEPRRAEVRFHCEEGVGDYIQQVDEPESCRYVFIIATTRVCHHPYLKPNPNRTPHNINCAPALSQDEFDQYQKVQEIKNIKLEKEKQKLLELENSDNLGQTGDLVNVLGDNDTDEDDSKWSIKLVTIPISKKGKLARNRLLNSEDIENFNGDADVFSSSITDQDKIFVDKPDEGGFQSVSSYLTENELLEREFNQIMKDFTEEKEEREKEVVTEEESKGKEDEDDKKVKKQFEVFRKRMEKLMSKWMEIQNEDHIHVLLDKIKRNLDENVQKLEETANKFSEESLNEYLNDLLDMAEKYKKNLPKVEDLDLEDEQKVLDALKSLTNLLTEAELSVLKAIHHKKKLDRLEKYLESQLKQTEKRIFPEEDKEKKEDEEVKRSFVEEKEDNEEEDSENPTTSSFSAQSTTPTPNPSEDPIIDPNDPDSKEGLSTTGQTHFPFRPFNNKIKKSLKGSYRYPLNHQRSKKRLRQSFSGTKIAHPLPPTSSSLSPLLNSKKFPSTPIYNSFLLLSQPDSRKRKASKRMKRDVLKEDTDQLKGGQGKIVGEKSLEENRKLRLEQGIKERLQKSGLDTMGRKIEVKILTPNYLDDDEKDSLSSLSQEETEAFHNMIVNILSASAEELQERERHKSLESNYNFRLEEPDLNMDDIISSEDNPDAEESQIGYVNNLELEEEHFTGTGNLPEDTDSSENFDNSDDSHSDNNDIIDDSNNDDDSISNDDNGNIDEKS